MKRHITMASLMVFLSLPVTAQALPDFTQADVCRKMMGERVGMWIHECRSMEADCRGELSKGDLPGDLKQCLQRFESAGSYCMVLRCVDPKNPAYPGMSDPLDDLWKSLNP